MINSNERRFIGALGAIPVREKATQRAGAIWINTVDELHTSLSSLSQEGKTWEGMVFGVNEKNRIVIDALEKEINKGQGRITYITGNSQTTALDFVTRAKGTEVFRNLQAQGMNLNLLIPEGRALPNNFFNLTPGQQDELRSLAAIYFLTKTLEQMIEVNASLLPEWHTLRAALINA